MSEYSGSHSYTVHPMNDEYAKRLYHKGTMSEGVPQGDTATHISFRNPLGQKV